MFDISIQSPTIGMALYCLFFYISINVINRKSALRYENVVSSRIRNRLLYRLMILGVFLLLMTNFYESDYFSYARMIQEYDFTPGAKNHGEPIYAQIAYIVNRNYLLFRAIVWGAALYFALKVFDQYGVNKYLGLYTLFSMYFVTHFISRSSLAVAVYFLGFAIFTRFLVRKDLLKVLLGILIMISSLIFHNSAIFLIVMTLSIFVPINKKTLVLAILCFPFFIYLMKDFFIEFLMFMKVNDSVIANKMEGYAERETDVANWKGWIRNIFLYASYYLPLVVMSIKLFFSKKKNSKKISKGLFYLYKISIVILLVSIGFGFMGFAGADFHQRTMWFLALPVPVLMCLFYKYGLFTKKVFYTLINIGIIYQLYVYTYTVYILMK